MSTRKEKSRSSQGGAVTRVPMEVAEQLHIHNREKEARVINSIRKEASEDERRELDTAMGNTKNAVTPFQALSGSIDKADHFDEADTSGLPARMGICLRGPIMTEIFDVLLHRLVGSGYWGDEKGSPRDEEGLTSLNTLQESFPNVGRPRYSFSPIIKITRAELMMALHMNPRDRNDVRTLSEALSASAKELYTCFWYSYETDKEGKRKPIPGEKGPKRWKMVYKKGTKQAFSVNEVREIGPDGKPGKLKYYEFTLHEMFADIAEIHRDFPNEKRQYLCIPREWIAEIEERYPGRKTPMTTIRLCHFIRWRQQKIYNGNIGRQKREDRKAVRSKLLENKIDITIDELCEYLAISEANLKKNRREVRADIKRALDDAKALQYIIEYDDRDPERYWMSINTSRFEKERDGESYLSEGEEPQLFEG